MDELTRIREAYARRDASGKTRLYSFFNSAHLFIIQQREKAILELLKENQLTNLADKKILDVGCGKGALLRNFIEYGASPANCFGIDILPDRIAEARRLSPHIDFQCGNAEHLDYADETFHIVLQFMVFTSVLDLRMKTKIAGEMLRVLHPRGVIIWYDYFLDNPSNPEVKGVKRQEIYRLFPGCDIRLKRLTLAPPLARAVAPLSTIVCQLLEKMPLLCTHYLGAIKKAGNASL